MRKIENIVVSQNAPSKESLWVNNGSLKYYGNSGWTLLGEGLGKYSDTYGVELNKYGNNKAGGLWSLATGESTSSLGHSSATFNENTVAYNPAESAFGRWNVSNLTPLANTSTLYSVGFGTGVSPKNAYEIMQNGDIYMVGIGNYDGTNPALAQSIQQVLASTSGGGTIDTAGTFDATPLKNNSTITEEFKNELLDAVKLHKLVYITYTDPINKRSYQSAVVFAGFDTENIKLTTYNNESTDIFTIKLADNSVKEESCNYTFYISDNAEKMNANRVLAADILFDRVEDVKIIGNINGEDYNTIGVYKNGFITALQDGQVVTFSVNFNTGKVEEANDEGRVVNYVMLDKGNTEEIKASNLEKLRKTEVNFLVLFDYGYGVGEFIDGKGGMAHITTPKGYDIFYDITTEGEVKQNDEYIKPNDPYTVILEVGKINSTLDEVTGSRVAKAGEIIVNSSAGPITYTRTIDSNKNVVYFTDDDRNGIVTRLTYTVGSKTLMSAEVPMRAASSVAIGGIKQGKYIANASSAFDAVDRFNSLLEELRTIGVLASN